MIFIQVEHISRMPENQLVIHGGCRLKILKRFLSSILDRAFLANFTWTGKTIGTDRKIPFGKFKKILDLMFALVTKNDENYPRKTMTDFLVNRILKYAYE